MFTQFTVSGASLKLLRVGERGTIARITDENSSIAQQLRRMGLYPGTSITLEERFPRFVVRTHQGTVALSQPMIQSIYVRNPVSI
ncbi:MAG: ferrous iron transport protein A [Cyanobacteria bacterium J06628_6]